MMKAMIHTAYGPPEVLKLGQIEKPTPEAGDVLVRVLAVSVNFGDLLVRDFKSVSPGRFSMPLPLWLPTRLMFGVRRPRQPVLGSEFAGIVEAVGGAVTRYRAGDAVFGYLGARMGANAEYVCVAQDGMLAHKPASLTFIEAASLPYGALTALSLLRKVGVRAGDKLLIIGASGAIGSSAVQLARHYGARVTGVCGARRMEMVRALGAEAVVDYAAEDFAARGETYDIIFDIPGKSSFAQCRPVLAPEGRYIRASFKTHHLIQMLLTAPGRGRKVICALSNERPSDLLLVKDLIESGALRPYVDRSLPLEQAPEAHRYLEAGQHAGRVVLVGEGIGK